MTKSTPTLAGVLEMEDPPSSASADEHALWLRTPALAHQRWRAGLRLGDGNYSAQTTAQYSSQFGAFCRWLAGEKLSLAQVTTEHIEQFLGTLSGRTGSPAARTQRMYLTEIDRVMEHLIAIGLRRGRPTEPLIGELRRSSPIRARSIHLPARDAVALLEQAVAPLLERDPAVDVTQARPLRDAAMVVLMLMAGFTAKEVQKISMRDLRRDPASPRQRPGMFVQAAGHRALRPRELKLTGWAAQVVARWWQVRSIQLSDLPSAAAAGELLFSNPRSQGARRGRAIDPTVIFDAPRKVFGEEAVALGLAPQRLRNAFIASLIVQGIEEEKIQAMTGLVTRLQFPEFRQALGVEPAPHGLAVA